MELVAEYIDTMPEDTKLDTFCNGITARIRSVYSNAGIDYRQLADHPEERMASSTVIFSAFHRQIWMIGDCLCLVDGTPYDNPKPGEDRCAEKRAAYIKQALAAGRTVEDIMRDDCGRRVIIPDIIKFSRKQNISYSVIDGFDIPRNKIKTVDINNLRHEIVLASDGYPFLKPTLAASENALREQLANDPLCINTFKATKGVMNGNLSFDDRSYVRFEIPSR